MITVGSTPYHIYVIFLLQRVVFPIEAQENYFERQPKKIQYNILTNVLDQTINSYLKSKDVYWKCEAENLGRALSLLCCYKLFLIDSRKSMNRMVNNLAKESSSFEVDKIDVLLHTLSSHNIALHDIAPYSIENWCSDNPGMAILRQKNTISPSYLTVKMPRHVTSLEGMWNFCVRREAPLEKLELVVNNKYIYDT